MLIPSGLLSKSYLTYFGKKLKKEIKKNTFNLLLLVSLSQGQMQHIFHYFLSFFLLFLQCFHYVIQELYFYVIYDNFYLLIHV